MSCFFVLVTFKKCIFMSTGFSLMNSRQSCMLKFEKRTSYTPNGLQLLDKPKIKIIGAFYVPTWMLLLFAFCANCIILHYDIISRDMVGKSKNELVHPFFTQFHPVLKFSAKTKFSILIFWVLQQIVLGLIANCIIFGR